MADSVVCDWIEYSDDDDDEVIEKQEHYKNNFRPDMEDPKGISFKGKTRFFANAVTKTKTILKKHATKQFENVKIKDQNLNKSTILVFLLLVGI